MEFLQNINNHNDLLRLTDVEKIKLCEEIRQFLVENVAKTGGHLAGNLGAVELSVAIETVYNTEKDRLVFDVGHQSYVHKILTGRRERFSTLRQFGGLSGFPKPSESVTDSFVAGHASSSVSIALGMARARTLMKEDYDVVALIGDGASTGGMAYEGMNDVGASREPMVIILNDNEMSIGRNVGGMSRHLSRLRSSSKYLGVKQWYRRTVKKIPGGMDLYSFTSRMKNRVKRFFLQTTIFENMGLTYLGPVDGHDLPALISVLKLAKGLGEPVLVHVVTRKGNGYQPAQDDPARFHGIGKFNPETGEKLGAKMPTFSDSFGDTMVELASRNNRVCAITAAMPGGTGLLKFMKQYPNRLFDVGIAEEHAVSMAGGLAKQGMIPVVAIYSTFLQRSYDQVMQDICMLHLHVVLAIDRAGLVGDDGPTHHGVFDVGFLRQMPGMLVLAPADFAEQQAMLRWAVEEYDGPVAIRYPRGAEGSFKECGWTPDCPVVCHRSGRDVALITYGNMLSNVLEAAERLSQRGIQAAVLRLTKLTDLKKEDFYPFLAAGEPVVVAEEACRGSGLREVIAWELRENPVIGLDLGEDFVVHGTQRQLYELCGLDGMSIAKRVEEMLAHEE